MGLTVRADVIENRLYFKLSGEFAKEELDKLYTDVAFLVADLTPGYGVIEDFSECDVDHLEGQALKKISNYLITNGLGEVVRIIDGKSLLYDQVTSLASVSSSGVIPVYAKTPEEAKEHLANSVKRNGIRFYVNNIPIEYIADNQRGTGILVNISTGGFSVESCTLPLSAGDEFIMRIILNNEDFTQDEFTVSAKVVRGGDDSLAAKFKGLNREHKEKLWKCLIHGSR